MAQICEKFKIHQVEMSWNKIIDMLLIFFQIPRENDQSPVQCVTAAVNEEITVYVQNADARHEKLGEMECVLQ